MGKKHKHKWSMIDVANPFTAAAAGIQGRKKGFEKPEKTTERVGSKLADIIGLDALMNLIYVIIGVAIFGFIIWVFFK